MTDNLVPTDHPGRSGPPMVRPAVSLLHRDPPYTAKDFFYHRRLVFAFTLSLVLGLAVLASYDGGRVLLKVDEPVAEWVARNRTPALTDFFNVASRVGDNVVVFSVAAVLAVFTWKHCRYLAVALVLAALVRPAVEFVLKAAVDRPRPDVEPLGHFAGPSHPAGTRWLLRRCWDWCRPGSHCTCGAAASGGRRSWSASRW